MTHTLSVDLNCDMGESYGRYSLGNDQAILPYISSASIACGYHAGDPGVMRKTVQLALAQGVSIGAHPGLPDLQGFGRRQMAVSPQETYEMVLYQLGALWAIVKAEGGNLQHVKPHGALYNMAAVDGKVAEAIAEAVYQLNAELVLYGLAGSKLVEAGERLGLKTAQEVFADRTYQQDGNLTPRNMPDALITDPDAAADQVLEMVLKGTVNTQQGTKLSIKADTVCIHGDGPHALLFAKIIYKTLSTAGITIMAVKH